MVNLLYKLITSFAKCVFHGMSFFITVTLWWVVFLNIYVQSLQECKCKLYCINSHTISALVLPVWPAHVSNIQCTSHIHPIFHSISSLTHTIIQYFRVRWGSISSLTRRTVSSSCRASSTPLLQQETSRRGTSSPPSPRPLTLAVHNTLQNHPGGRENPILSSMYMHRDLWMKSPE